MTERIKELEESLVQARQQFEQEVANLKLIDQDKPVFYGFINSNEFKDIFIDGLYNGVFNSYIDYVSDGNYIEPLITNSFDKLKALKGFELVIERAYYKEEKERLAQLLLVDNVTVEKERGYIIEGIKSISIIKKYLEGRLDKPKDEKEALAVIYAIKRFKKFISQLEQVFSLDIDAKLKEVEKEYNQFVEETTKELSELEKDNK